MHQSTIIHLKYVEYTIVRIASVAHTLVYSEIYKIRE